MELRVTAKSVEEGRVGGKRKERKRKENND
jgi:hypothetical protein